MKAVFFVIMFTFFTFLGFAQNEISNNDKIYGLSLLWKEIDYNFPYFDRVPELNWDSLYLSYIPKILNTENDVSYYNVLDEFIANLHEGHTRIIRPQKLDKKTYLQIYCNITDAGIFVTGVGESLKDSIPIGSQILEIDDLDPFTYMDKKVLPFISVNDHVKYVKAANVDLFAGEKGTRVKIKIKTLKNPNKTVILERTGEYGKWVGPYDIKLADGFSFKRLDNDIAYIRFGSFTSYKFIEEFFAIIDELEDCKGIIIDLRGNYGGTSYGDKICEFFTKKEKFESFACLTRINNAYLKALGAYSDSLVANAINVTPRYQKYSGYYVGNEFKLQEFFSEKDTLKTYLDQPLVVLINEFTASAAETFLITLKNINRGIFVGTPSSGSSCQPLVVLLPGGGQARICTQKAVFADGELFNYIPPDFEIKPSVQDYISENDVVLNKGIEILLDLVKSGN